MVELDRKRSTDVPGSIAGFYYQILLACKEVSRYGEVEEVGVETGADVNVITVSKGVVNIEAKLHQDNFGKYAEDIVKTIYNFYKSDDKNIEKLVFSTNAAPTQSCKLFFENWGTNGTEENYIKECILRKSVDGPYKKAFEKFCADLYIQKRAEKDNRKYIDLLVEETLSGTGKYQYEDYAVTNKKITYKDFIKLLNFSFAHKKKRAYISEIRTDIMKNINDTICKIGLKPLETEECDIVINKMIDYFLDVILLNSQNNSSKRVTSADYVNIIKNYQKIEEKHISKYQIFACLQSMQREEEEIREDIKNRASSTERDALEENYKFVQEIMLTKMASPDGYMSFIQSYQLKANPVADISIILIKIVYALSIIMTKEHLKINDIEILCQKSINNIRVRNFIECSYKKSFSSAYRTMDRIVAELIRMYQRNANINENQVFIVDAEYKDNGEPCKGVLNPEVYNITQTDENYNDYLLFCSMNYKCTRCLDINDQTGYNKFKYGGGNLCKKI